jgi:4-hydroxybenzoate polyprenyltransferase
MLAFLKLIRFPNLLIIILTQYFIRYAVLLPFFEVPSLKPGFSHLDFALLVLSTVFIAAAGYVINDYFDTRTDRINRPESVVIDKGIKRRVAMALHVLFNFIGIGIGIYLGYKAGEYKLALLHVFAAGLLWFYSTDFKKQFLIGNIIVSLLTACVPMVVPFFEIPLAKTEVRKVQEDGEKMFQKYMDLVQGTGQVITEQQAQEITYYKTESDNYPVYVEQANYALNLAFKVTAIFALFSFLLSMIREIIKDIEDYEGDKATGCRTLPIVAGIRNAKHVTALLIAATVAGLAYFQFLYYSQQGVPLESLTYFEGLRNTILPPAYVLLAVQIPLILLLVQLFKAQTPLHFHRASMLVKLIMLIGLSFSWVIFYNLTSAMAG